MKIIIFFLTLVMLGLAQAQDKKTEAEAPCMTQACQTPAAGGMLTDNNNRCSPEVANNKVPGLDDRQNDEMRTFCAQGTRQDSGGGTGSDRTGRK